MQSIKGFKYLYKRKSTFYFRFKLPKNLTSSELRFCLRTQNLTKAVIIWDQLQPFVKQLKHLVSISETLENHQIQQYFERIKSSMLKQLQMEHIDQLIAKREKNYNSGSHTVNALADKTCISEFDDNFINQAVNIFNVENSEELAIKLSETTQSLKSTEEKSSFVESMASLIKGMTHMMSADEDSELDAPRPRLSNEQVELQARNLLEENDYEVNPHSIAFKTLKSKLRTSIALQQEIFESVISEDSITERELSSLVMKKPEQIIVEPIPPPEQKHNTPLFSEVYKEFLDIKINKGNLSEKMQKDYERKLIIWNTLSEDKSISTYTRRDIGAFIDRCFDLPKMNIAPYNKMTWAQRLNVDVPDAHLAAPKSVEHIYKWLQGIFSYAKKDQIGYINRSPCSIKRNFKSGKRGIFSDQELKIFLEAADSETRSWKKWIIYLAIYTGARRTELVQLRKEDVKLDPDTNRYYFLITDEHESQQLKTDNAKRKIPVHNDLIKYGFIDYVKSCKDRVFDEVNNGEVVTGWMARHMDKLNIQTMNELDGMRSFHSFRHTFVTKAVQKVHLSLVQQFVGHEITSMGITGRYLHRATDIKPLLPVVDTFEI